MLKRKSPTIYATRIDKIGRFLSSLSLLTNHDHPEAFIRVMATAQKFTASIDFEDFDLAPAALAAANAFEEPSKTMKLKIPT